MPRRPAVWTVIIGVLISIPVVVGTSGAFSSAAATDAALRSAAPAIHKYEPQYSSRLQWSRLPRAVTPARVVASAPRTYIIHTGDTLSSISARMYGTSKDWTVIYWSNRKTVFYANVIISGHALLVPGLPLKIPAPPSQLGPPAPVVHVAATAPASTTGQYQCGDGDGDGYDMPCGSQQNSTPVAQAPVQQAQTSVNPGSYSGFQACVIARESGGNPNVWNPSGHWGLYQFDQGTWISGGGTASNFGNASVATQNQVFASVYAARGNSPWTPSDGC